MNRSPGKRIVIPAVTVAAGLALLAGSVLGGPAEDGPGPPAPPPGGPLVLKAERVADPATAKAGDNPRVFYLETTTPVDDIPPGPYGYIVKRCPNDSRAINGYYFQTTEGGNGQPVGVYHGFGLDDQGSSPRGFYKWSFYLDNVAVSPESQPVDIDGVTFGLVCDKDG